MARIGRLKKRPGKLVPKGVANGPAKRLRKKRKKRPLKPKGRARLYV